jgi:hypothetical protein
MKTSSSLYSFGISLVALSVLVPHSSWSAPVSASVLAVSGDVFTDNSVKLQVGAGLDDGASIRAEDQSGGIIRPVPGQLLVIDSNSIAKMDRADVAVGDAADGGAARSSSLSLQAGHVNMTVASPKTGSNQLDLVSKYATASSSGGNFSAWSNDSGEQHLVVYAGSVDLKVDSGSAVTLRAGQVGTWRCDGSENGLEVLDLRTGTISEYLAGNAIGTRLATPAELRAASGYTFAGLSAFRTVAPREQQVEFAQIISDINGVQVGAGLAAIPPSTEWYLFPNLANQPPNSSPDFASPIQP